MADEQQALEIEKHNKKRQGLEDMRKEREE